MEHLAIGPDWAREIARIRDEHSDETPLIRFDNLFYRICRANATPFELRLWSEENRSGAFVDLTIDPRNFYVTHIGNCAFERYASTIDTLKPHGQGLAAAVHDLPGAVGDRLFLLRSLLVFCVAESIRNDAIATRIGQTVASAHGRLLGASPVFQLREHLPAARIWGQTSEAILGSLSPGMQAYLSQPGHRAGILKRPPFERVELTRLPAQFAPFARSIRVLKRPG